VVGAVDHGSRAIGVAGRLCPHLLRCSSCSVGSNGGTLSHSIVQLDPRPQSTDKTEDSRAASLGSIERILLLETTSAILPQSRGRISKQAHLNWGRAVYIIVHQSYRPYRLRVRCEPGGIEGICCRIDVEWQCEGERTSLAGNALDLDVSTVSFHNFP
jgi:hypothetical protein